MRASIAPLFILAFVFADVALKLRPDEKWPKKAVFWIVSLGAFTPGLEIRDVVSEQSFAISSCDLLTAAHAIRCERDAGQLRRQGRRGAHEPHASGAGSGLSP